MCVYDTITTKYRWHINDDDVWSSFAYSYIYLVWFISSLLNSLRFGIIQTLQIKSVWWYNYTVCERQYGTIIMYLTIKIMFFFYKFTERTMKEQINK